MTTKIPYISANGYSIAENVINDEWIPSMPGLSPKECREIYASQLNYISGRIAARTKPAWPWNSSGEPIKRY